MKKSSLYTIGAHIGLLLVAIALAGCSAESRKARQLDQAKRMLDAGDYDGAEIGYMNVLKADATNAEAFSRLGIMYFDQGRVGQMSAFLMRAKELQPDNLEVRVRLGKCFLLSNKFEDARNEALFVLQRQPQTEDAPALLATSAVKPAEIDEARRLLQSLPPAVVDSAPVIVALGTLDLRQGKTKEAEAAFHRAETLAPKSGVAQSIVGTLYWSQNDLTRADRAFAIAAEQSPPRSPRRVQYAQFKIKTKDVAGGRALFEGLVKQTPDFIPAILGLAEVAGMEKKYDEANTLLAKALARDPTHPEALLMNARLLLTKNEPAKAIPELEKMLKVYPQSAGAYHLLGNAFAATGEFDKAMNSFRQAIAIAPGFIDAALALAGLNIRKGDFASALGPLKAIVQQRPDLPQASLLLADAHRGMGNLDEVLAIYRRLNETNPSTPEVSMLMGMVLMQQRKPIQAREAFDKALQASPNYIPAAEQLVTLDLQENKPQAALQRAEALIARNQAAGGPQMLLAKVHLLQKNTAQAEAALRKTIELEPENSSAYFVLARLYMDAGQLPKAISQLQSVLDKKPNDAAALMLSGVLNDQQKNYAAARDAYEKLLTTNPNSVAALNNLAFLYAEQFGQLDKAQELAQKAREAAPTQPHTADTLGWVLYKKRQYARALILIQEAAGKLPKSGQVQYHLGMTHYMLGQEVAARTALTQALEIESDFPGAEEARQAQTLLALDTQSRPDQARLLLEKAIAARPDDPVALSRLASAYEYSGAKDKALETYEKALKASPNNLNASLGLIKLLSGRGETAKALELAKNVRKFAQDDVRATHILGKLAYQTGDSVWASSLLQEASRKEGDLPELWFDLGLASYSAGKITEAESALKRALELSATFPHATDVRTFLALIPAANGGDANRDAISRAEEVLKTDPTHGAALMTLGRSQEKKGDLAAARKTYENLIRRHPDFTPAKRQLAILYSTESIETEKAYAFALKARETLQDDLELNKAYGILLYRKKEYTRAVRALQESANSRKDDPELMYYIGMSKRELKDNNGAKLALQSALDLKINPKLASEAQRALAELK